MSDYPDLYADGFSLTAGPFGVTITLHRSDPTGEAGPHQDPNEIVGRVRISRELSRVLAEQLNQMLAASAQSQASSSVKHRVPERRWAAAAAALDARPRARLDSAPNRIRAVNGTSTRRASAERSGGWWKPERRRQGMDPGASGPNDQGAATHPPSRLRRKAPAIQGSADQQLSRAVRRSGKCGTSPNEGGTAEGTAFRPERTKAVS